MNELQLKHQDDMESMRQELQAVRKLYHTCIREHSKQIMENIEKETRQVMEWSCEKSMYVLKISKLNEKLNKNVEQVQSMKDRMDMLLLADSDMGTADYTTQQMDVVSTVPGAASMLLSTTSHLGTRPKVSFQVLQQQLASAKSTATREHERHELLLEEKSNLLNVAEDHITLLKNAKAIIGNSSSGVREAPVLGVPSINIGSRQEGRVDSEIVLNTLPNFENLKLSWDKVSEIVNKTPIHNFGSGNVSSFIYNKLTTINLNDFNTQKKYHG